MPKVSVDLSVDFARRVTDLDRREARDPRFFTLETADGKTRRLNRQEEAAYLDHLGGGQIPPVKEINLTALAPADAVPDPAADREPEPEPDAEAADAVDTDSAPEDE